MDLSVSGGPKVIQISAHQGANPAVFLLYDDGTVIYTFAKSDGFWIREIVVRSDETVAPTLIDLPEKVPVLDISSKLPLDNVELDADGHGDSHQDSPHGDSQYGQFDIEERHVNTAHVDTGP